MRTREGGFTPKGSDPRAPLPFMMRPSNYSNFAVFASDDGEFEAYVLNAVLAKMDAELVRARPFETIGLLAGRVMRDSRGPYTLVLACEDARGDETEATPGHVRISAAGHAKLRQRLETTAYGLDLVGWYHSHPRFPAQFSSVDTTEQSTLKDPNHLGIVVSGNDDIKPYGVYRGPGASLLVAQTIIRRYIPPYVPKPVVVSNDRIVAPISLSRPSVSPSSIATGDTAKNTLAAESFVSKARFHRSFRFRRVLVVASALSALAILLWTNYRIYSIENKLGSLADMKTVTASDDHARPPASPSMDNSKVAENPALTLANEKSIGSLDPRANPKLPLSKSPDTSKKKKARIGSDNPRNANRSSGSVGALAVKQGAVRRSAMPNPTPKPIPMPTIKPLPKPLPRPLVKTND
jgi:proteasome lid subunit RPN8/RPN11